MPNSNYVGPRLRNPYTNKPAERIFVGDETYIYNYSYRVYNRAKDYAQLQNLDIYRINWEPTEKYFSFEFFRLASLIGGAIELCEDDKPIEERLPYEMITAYNGKIVHVKGDSKYNVVTCIYEVWYSFEIRIDRKVIYSRTDLTNVELLTGIYNYFQSEK